LAIFMEIGTIFTQQDTPAHSFGGKSKSDANPRNSLWRNLPFAVKGGFYLVGDVQKRASLSDDGLEIEPIKGVYDVEGNHDCKPKGDDCHRVVMAEVVAMP